MTAHAGNDDFPQNRFPQGRYFTRHLIYDRLLTLLANPQIRSVKTGRLLRCILHEKTKRNLLSGGFSSRDVVRLEAEEVFAAEYYLRDYEVARDVPAVLFNELERRGTSDLIFKNRIVPLPGFIYNALLCEALGKEFSPRELLNCPGFIEVAQVDCDDDDDEGAVYKSIRLDIDPHLARAGFMMPIYRGGNLIVALKVFRHPADERPFWLRSRERGKEGENNY